MPTEALPHPPAAPDTAPAPAAPLVPAAETPPAPTVAAASAAAGPAGAPEPEISASAPPSSLPEQALIAHLERALEQAQARELRLLDLLAQRTGSQSTPLLSAPQPAPPARTPAAAPHPAAPPPLSGLRQQIVAVLQQHPEGLSPKAVQTRLQLDTDVRSTMKSMVHRGLLTRLEAGRYVVAPGVAHP